MSIFCRSCHSIRIRTGFLLLFATSNVRAREFEFPDKAYQMSIGNNVSQRYKGPRNDSALIPTWLEDEARGQLVRERPIIMSGDNPKLISDGRKTMTRRIANIRGADRVVFVENAQLVPVRKGDNSY